MKFLLRLRSVEVEKNFLKKIFSHDLFGFIEKIFYPKIKLTSALQKYNKEESDEQNQFLSPF